MSIPSTYEEWVREQIGKHLESGGQERLLRWATQRTNGDREKAEDLVQSGLLLAVRQAKWWNVYASGKSLHTWLIDKCRLVWLKHKCFKPSQDVELDVLERDGAVDTREADETRIALREAMEKLSEEDARIASLYLLEGHSLWRTKQIVEDRTHYNTFKARVKKIAVQIYGAVYGAEAA